MDILRQLALVAETDRVSASELTRAAAALQKQALRDFSAIWDVVPTVDAFVTLDDVPLGYWPIIIRDDIGFPGAAGIHLDKDGQPFALVQFSSGWTLTASHECLEMLADPFGNRLVAGPSLKPGQGRVEFLLEVCDPSEDEEFAYTVNGVLVSDFYTPRFFDPVAVAGTRYSYTGAITQPRQVLQGGYISWHDPVSDHWFQQIFFSGSPEIRDLGTLAGEKGSLREIIDRHTPPPRLQSGGVRANARGVAMATAAAGTNVQASSAKSKSWRAQIDQLKQQYQKP
jgi:hypothetical protein